jgi:hypothetical protein
VQITLSTISISDQVKPVQDISALSGIRRTDYSSAMPEQDWVAARIG